MCLESRKSSVRDTIRYLSAWLWQLEHDLVVRLCDISVQDSPSIFFHSEFTHTNKRCQNLHQWGAAWSQHCMRFD